MTLRQKLRKYVKDFEEEMKGFRENPDDQDSDAEELDKEEVESGWEDDDLALGGPATFKKETSVIR